MSSIAYNNSNTDPAERSRIASTLGVSPDLVWATEGIRALEVWQASRDLKADGLFGPRTRRSMERLWGEMCADCEAPITPRPTEQGDAAEESRSINLDGAEKLRLCSYTFLHESGAAGYAAMNLNGEYLGRFDRPRDRPVEARHDRHWASRFNHGGGAMIGLSYGKVQHTQDGGGLGKVLRRARFLSGGEFDSIINANTRLRGSADDLIEVTNRPGGDKRINARSRRVQPVAGVDLWERPWTDVFRNMATRDWMRQAQDERMIEGYLTPMLAQARARGITRHALIAIMFDVAIQCGKAGAESYLRRAFDRDPPQDGGTTDDINRFIGALPAHLRERRRNILRAADKRTYYRNI